MKELLIILGVTTAWAIAVALALIVLGHLFYFLYLVWESFGEWRAHRVLARKVRKRKGGRR